MVGVLLLSKCTASGKLFLNLIIILSIDSLVLFFNRRFTGDIAKDAHHVTAVDFMQSFTDKNKEVNGAKFNNIDFVCADVTKLEQPHGR